MDNLNFFYGRWSYKLAVFPICNLLELGETCGFQIQKAWPRSERFPQLSPRIYLVFFSCVGVFTVWTAHAACCQLPHQQVQLMNQHLTLFFYASVVELFCRGRQWHHGATFPLHFPEATTESPARLTAALVLLLVLLDCALHQINEQERHFITKLSLGVFISFSHWCNPSILHATFPPPTFSLLQRCVSLSVCVETSFKPGLPK